MPWSPAETALFWIAVFCAGLFALPLLGLCVTRAPEVRHPFRADLPEWWG